MNTTVLTKGHIVLPEEIRRRDKIKSGQQFEVERIGDGDYRLRRKKAKSKKGWVKLLFECPEKNWFVPADRSETTADIKPLKFE